MSSCVRSPSTSTTTTTTGDDQSGGISSIHPDIIATHILTRLDGLTLASAGCASSQLHRLCTEEKLWRDICTSTWPSIEEDPSVRETVSTFPSGYRSFFSDSFPTLYNNHRHRHPTLPLPPPTSELISAVDIRYQNKPFYSKVQSTETLTGWFLCSPFWIDLLDLKETAPTPLKLRGEEAAFLSHLEESMTLSWILIDPARNRSGNVSSLRPDFVTRHWLTRDIHMQFSTVMAGTRSTSEFVQYKVQVTCGVKDGGGELFMREVNLQVQDMDEKSLSGRASLVILQEAMENGMRKSGGERERYEEYLEMKKVRKEKKERRERRLNVTSVAAASTALVALFTWLVVGRLLFG